MGIHPAEAIVAERKAGGKVTSLSDFLVRCSNNLNKKVLENLAMAGALDSLAERNQVISNLDELVLFLGRTNKERPRHRLACLAMSMMPPTCSST